MFDWDRVRSCPPYPLDPCMLNKQNDIDELDVRKSSVELKGVNK